jgi:GT2 family glycosyltransferase
MARVASREHSRPVGAVVAYGRTFIGRGAHTVNLVPPPGSPQDLVPVDVACWGATLVSRSVVDAGVLPDPEWFFGLEDFDFFCRVREAGLDVLVDAVAARQVAVDQTGPGRDRALQVRRPTDQHEAWRSYYHSRNSIALARRHGRASWIAWHLAYSARHLQTAHSREQRGAIARGLWDGVLGRMGEHPRYGRRMGEFNGTPPSEPTSPTAT